MNKIVCGADVCKDSIVCCFLSEILDDIPHFFKQQKKTFPKLYAHMGDVRKFLAHKPTHLVLSPTGTNYAWIWAEVASQNGVKVLWVPDHKCESFRIRHELPAENDQAGALALACEGLTYKETSKSFLNFNHRDGLSELRELVLHHHSLNRIKSPVVNRLRQQLAREFPSAALIKTKEGADGIVPLWAWLAQVLRHLKCKPYYYDNKWSESLGKFLGLEISEFTRGQASQKPEI